MASTPALRMDWTRIDRMPTVSFQAMQIIRIAGSEITAYMARINSTTPITSRTIIPKIIS
jgi:hypothetical protein